MLNTVKIYLEIVWEKAVKYKKWVAIGVATKLMLLVLFAPCIGISDGALITSAILIVGLMVGFVVWCFHCAFVACEVAEDLEKGV